MSVKQTKIIDLNLFSGSSELLRQIAGGYYQDAEGTGEITFFDADMTANISGVESVERSEVTGATFAILPRITYSNRLFVDESYGFVSDEDWRTFIVGGTYGDTTYSGLYNESVYADHVNDTPLPYVPREIVNIAEDVLTPSLTLTTEYYNYYPRFQAEVTGLESALEAPNYYLLDSSSYLQPSYNSAIVQSKYQYSNLESFLSDEYVNSEKTIDTDLENIFVIDGDALDENNGVRLDTEDLLEHGDFDSDLGSLYSLMPFGNKLEIASELGSGSLDFRDIINNNSFQVKFIKLLKEAFQQESGLQTATTNFIVNTQAESSTGILTGSLETTTTVPVNIIDVPTMLAYSYRNPIAETTNISVFNSGSYENEINYAMDTTGMYRYENTETSLSVFNEFMLAAKNKFETTTETTTLDNFLNAASNSKYHETMAYRIEKIGGPPTGDSRTQNTIQNIWFYNNDSAITYLDTQVKYDTEYTYKIYKYELIQGYKYQLSDMAITRQLAVTSSAEGDIYCLEFYDPFTGIRTERLLPDEGYPPEFVANIQARGTALNELSGALTAARNQLTQFTTTKTTSGLNSESTTIKGNSDNDDVTNSEFYQSEFQDYDAYPYYVSRITFNNEALPELGEITFNYYYFGQMAIDFYKAALASGATVENSLETFRTSNGGTLDYAAVSSFKSILFDEIGTLEDNLEAVTPLLQETAETFSIINETNSLATAAQINSTYPQLADFRVTIEPSLKIVEIPIEQKSMRIVDHPPNDLVITPHHLLDQTNRLAFYCKYDTFSMDTVTYPQTLRPQDEENRSAYLTGHDFVAVSKQTQESVSRARFIEVYRTTTKPTSYEDFLTNPRTTIDLRQPNDDIPTDHLFVERVRENTIYYYMFRAVNENGVAGQMSPVFESELVDDGGYVYGRFEQYSEDELRPTPQRQPLAAIKKLFSVVPNIQHLQLDSSAASFVSSSSTQIDNITLGDSNVVDPLFSDDSDRYFKIRLTSKKTGRKLDINIGFKKEVRK